MFPSTEHKSSQVQSLQAQTSIGITLYTVLVFAATQKMPCTQESSRSLETSDLVHPCLRWKITMPYAQSLPRAPSLWWQCRKCVLICLGNKGEVEEEQNVFPRKLFEFAKQKNVQTYS